MNHCKLAQKPQYIQSLCLGAIATSLLFTPPLITQTLAQNKPETSPQTTETNKKPETTNPETDKKPETTTETTETNKKPETTNPDTPATNSQPLLLKQGILEQGDTTIDDGSYYDTYSLEGKKDQSLIITLESQEFDPYLAIQNPEGQIIGENDDAAEGSSNSQLKITLPMDGAYQIIVNSFDPKGQGKYTLKAELDKTTEN